MKPMGLVFRLARTAMLCVAATLTLLVAGTLARKMSRNWPYQSHSSAFQRIGAPRESFTPAMAPTKT